MSSMKQLGDTVAAEEVTAGIETDKRSLFDSSLDPESISVNVAVNSPKARKIVDRLAREEDTVAVGQDLFALNTDASPTGMDLHEPLF